MICDLCELTLFCALRNGLIVNFCIKIIKVRYCWIIRELCEITLYDKRFSSQPDIFYLEPGPWSGQGFQKGVVQPYAGVSRFLLPASEGAYIVQKLLEELGTDQWPVPPGNRSLRCTGVALSLAAGFLGACMPGTGSRIVALVGGPCTEGPGSIVSKDLSEPVRSHKDLDKDAAPYFRKAVQFYEELSKQMVSQGHVLDLFASALDQTMSLPPVQIEEIQPSPSVSPSARRPSETAVSVASGLRVLHENPDVAEAINTPRTSSNGLNITEDAGSSSRVFGRTFSGLSSVFMRGRPPTGQ